MRAPPRFCPRIKVRIKKLQYYKLYSNNIYIYTIVIVVIIMLIFTHISVNVPSTLIGYVYSV